jgi:hypothetical protein
MTRRARHGRNAVPLLSAYHIEQVGMAVIALLRIAGGRVAIDAAGMREHRIHLLPGAEAFGARRCAGCESPFDRDEEGQGHGDSEALSAIHEATVTLRVRAAIVKTCSID